MKTTFIRTLKILIPLSIIITLFPPVKYISPEYYDEEQRIHYKFLFNDDSTILFDRLILEYLIVFLVLFSLLTAIEFLSRKKNLGVFIVKNKWKIVLSMLIITGMFIYAPFDWENKKGSSFTEYDLSLSAAFKTVQLGFDTTYYKVPLIKKDIFESELTNIVAFKSWKVVDTTFNRKLQNKGIDTWKPKKHFKNGGAWIGGETYKGDSQLIDSFQISDYLIQRYKAINKINHRTFNKSLSQWKINNIETNFYYEVISFHYELFWRVRYNILYLVIELVVLTVFISCFIYLKRKLSA